VVAAWSAPSSPFILTNEARAQAEWKPAFLEVRQKRLIGVLSKHCELDLNATDVDTDTASVKEIAN